MTETLILRVVLVLPVWIAACVLQMVVNISRRLSHWRTILTVDHQVLILRGLQFELRIWLRRLGHVLPIQTLIFRFQVNMVLCCYISC